MRTQNVDPMERLNRILNLWLVYFTGFLILAASLFGLQNWSIVALPKYWLFLAILLGGIITWFLGHPDSPILRGSTRAFLLVWVSFAILLRFLWIIAIPTLPISDFDFYNSFAAQIAQNGQLSIVSITGQMYGWGYPLILAIFYKIFGVNLLLAKYLNVIFSALMAILLFRIAHILFDERVARVSMILFVFWPSQIMMNSVLASEHVYTIVMLLGVTVLISTLQGRSPKWRGISFAGVLIGLSSIIRSTSVAVALTSSAVTFLYSDDFLKKRVGRVTILMSSFLFVVGCYLGVLSMIGSNSNLGFFSLLAHQLLVGTNFNSKGMWNPEDSRIWSEYNATDATYKAYHESIERIVSDPDKFAVLVSEKFSIMWSDELYGAYWSTTKMSNSEFKPLIERWLGTLYAVSQYYYIWVLMFCCVGCYKSGKENINTGLRLLFMIFLAFALLHSFIEVQPRYHYPWELIFLILGAYGIVR